MEGGQRQEYRSWNGEGAGDCVAIYGYCDENKNRNWKSEEPSVSLLQWLHATSSCRGIIIELSSDKVNPGSSSLSYSIGIYLCYRSDFHW